MGSWPAADDFKGLNRISCLPFFSVFKPKEQIHSKAKQKQDEGGTFHQLLFKVFTG